VGAVAGDFFCSSNQVVDSQSAGQVCIGKCVKHVHELGNTNQGSGAGSGISQVC